MRSIKTLLLTKFLSLTIIIIGLMYFTNESLLIDSIKESTKNTITQKAQHVSSQLDLLFDNHNKTLKNFTNHQIFSAYISEGTKTNTEILKEHLSEKIILASKPKFAIIDFENSIAINLTGLIIKPGSYKNKTISIIEEKTLSEMTLENHSGVDYVVFLNAVQYHKHTEIVLVSYFKLEYFKNLVNQHIGKDFAISLLPQRKIIEKENTIFVKNSSIPQMFISLSYKKSIYSDIISTVRNRSIIYATSALLLAGIIIIVLIVPRITKEIFHIESLIKDLTKSETKNVKANTYISEIVSLEKTINSLLRDLDKEKEESLSKAHKAGMAEIAISVLHNIGNILTSINLRISNASYSSDTEKVSLMLNSFKNKLDVSLEHTEDNKKLFLIVEHFSSEMDVISNHIKDDFSFYKKQISHISDIISTQQNMTGSESQNKVKVNLKEVADDCLKLKMDELEKSNIKVENQLSDSFIHVDKFGLAQVILNFLVNSMDSINERKMKEINHFGVITLENFINDDLIDFKINDNGMGISKKTKENIFNFGFSTKDRSSGFGLHNCANYVKANKGTLIIDSPGEMKGAEVIMSFKNHTSSTT